MRRRFAGATRRELIAAVLLAIVSGLVSIPRTSVTSAAPLFPTFAYSSDANYVGNFTSYAQAGNTITLNAGNDKVKVIVNEHDLVRIAYGPGGVFADENASYAVVKYAWSNPTPLVEDRSTDLVITTDQLYVRIIKTPLRIEFYDKTPTLLGRDRNGVGRFAANGHVALSQALAADEHIYGFGERCATSLDCRGLQLENWTRDAYNAKDGMKYKAFTLYHSTKGYGVFVDNHAHAVIDIGQSVADELEYDFDGGKLDYYFFKGTSRQVLERYTDLTGRPALFPKWALGYQQSKWAYETRAELLATADTFRSKNIPSDVLWLDGPERGWWPSGRNVDPSFDSRYPDPTGMIAELASKGFKLGLLINQTMDTVAPKYTEGLTNNYYVKNQDGSTFISSQWNGSAATVDFTKAGAGAWFGGLVAPLVNMGARAWWIDMDDGGYPENLDGYYNRVFAGGPGWKVHNVNGGLLDANALRSSLTQQTPNARQFVMTRGGASGMQRSAWTWSADLQFNSWEDLKRQLRMEQNMSMVGVVYSSDIGGADCPLGNNGEAYLRWMQVEMFNFFTRSHFNGANCVDKHPWTYGATIESAWKTSIGWKYRMLPYIYTEHHTYTQTGTPLHRPLVFDHPNDANVYNKPDEFMFGDWLLAAPVVDGNNSTGASNTSRSVYLPAGTWIDYRDGKTSYAGPTTLANYTADLTTVPLFVKAGAIIPMQPLMQYVGQLPLNLLTLDVYPSGNSSYTMYEDDGMSFGYLSGAWVKTTFDSTTTGINATLVINARQSGGGAFVPAARDYMLKLHNRDDGVNTVKVNGVDLPSTTQAALNAGQTGWNHDLVNDLIWVRFADTGEAMTIAVTDGGAPTIAVAASASPNPATLMTTNLSVMGTDDGGESNLTYTWTTLGTPPAPVTFSANGSNAAKTTTATFTAVGAYSFQVTIRDQGNLTVTSSVGVFAGVDTTAPMRSNGAPSGTLGAGTTQASLSLTTNESATCRYGTTGGTAYNALPNAFTTSGATTHSTVISGLTNGSSYSYVVRCQDTANNANADDYVIAFAVSNPPASITLVAPTNGLQGTTNLAVTVTGAFTSWVNGTTVANFGSGITATTTVTDSTHLTATLTIAVGATVGTRTVTITTGPQVLTLASGFAVTAPPPVFTPVRINSGGGAFTDSLGRAWSADQFFSGGGPDSTTVAVAGTTDDVLYNTERYGNFAYNISAPAGTYAVTLRFAELYWTTTGKRRFSVAIEGQPVLADFDIVAAGGANAAVDRTFQVSVSDGTLNIVFTTIADNAEVTALEVVAGVPAPDTAPPVRTNGAPSSALASGTTQAAISLTTNENATCRYGTTAGTAYGSLPNAFATSGATTHSTVVTGLTNGASYSYVVRCQDALANANPDDYVIAFSVAVPNTPPTISDVVHQSIATNTSTGALAFAVGDAQTAAGSLTVTRASSNLTLVPVANIVLGGSGATRTVTVTPATNQSGTATITVTVSDGLLTASDTFGVTVTAPPVTTTTLFPTGATIVTGTLNGGTATSLSSDDNAYFAVNSTTSGTRTTAWYGSFTGVSASVTNLRVNYKGNNSASCTQTIAMWRWTDSAWVQLDARSVTTTEIAINNLVPTGTLANYVSTSGNGELRVRVQCTRTGNFTARGDVMSIVYDVPGPPPPDTAAPVLSGGAPSGTLAANTTQTTLILATNENATCRYATTAGVAYASMPTTFTTTGGTAHSVVVTGLVNGSSYSYFVRCQDAVPNANPTDYAISFSVATSTPALTLVSPAAGIQGASNLVVTVTGQFTNWVNGTTTASFGAGITAATSVTDATHLTATVSISAAATIGTRTVTITTGAQVLTLTNGFTVTAAFTPIRINAGGPSFVDSLGQTWAADKNFSGGAPDTSIVAVAGTTDDTLYHTERYGNFSYNIPVPTGTYAVTLRFAELYWTATGKRSFSVAIESQSVLSNFDIVAAGGANTAVDRTFQVTVTDGTLNIVFTTLIDNADVTAIQVVAGN